MDLFQNCIVKKHGDEYHAFVYLNDFSEEFSKEFNDDSNREEKDEQLSKSAWDYVKKMVPNKKIAAVTVMAGAIALGTFTGAGSLGSKAFAAGTEQVTVESATTAVGNLFSDSGKTALAGGVNQAAIDAAKVQVNSLVDGTNKTSLSNDITKAQGFLDVSKATASVNALFSDQWKTALAGGVDQAAIDAAKTKVNALSTSTVKTTLTDEIADAQTFLNAQNLATTTTSVNALFSSAGKTSLAGGVDQAAIDAAKTKVNALPDGTNKTKLSSDITKAQGFLDSATATTSVNALFSDQWKTSLASGTNQAAIDAAKVLVNALPDTTNKSTLNDQITDAQNFLNAQNLTTATTAVNALFLNSGKTALAGGVDQAAIDVAKTKVNVVPDGTNKTKLNSDITKAQGYLDLATATASVNGLFSDGTKTALGASVTQATINSAKAQVTSLPAGIDKTAFNADIAKAQNLLSTLNMTSATTAVNALFTSDWKNTLAGGVDQAAINSAKDLVKNLPSGTDKTNLNADIATAQDLLNSQSQVTATTAVNALFSTPSKTALGGSVDQTAIDAAKAKVKVLPDGTTKTNLNADIAKAQGFLNLSKATTAVNALFTSDWRTALGATVDQTAINSAKDLVNLLPDGADKTTLTGYVADAQNLLNTKNLTTATTSVNALFTNAGKTALDAGVTQATINSAKDLVNVLPDGTSKTNLNADIMKAQTLINPANLTAANTSVSALFTDGDKTALGVGVTQATIDAAKTQVNVLLDGANKTALNADIAKAQTLINPANLVTATTTVNNLFTDDKKIALKAGVNQAAIDTAKTQVNSLLDGTEKTALNADITKAQNFLNAQDPATTTTTVNNLFANDEKTVLKNGITQADIDLAKTQVTPLLAGTTKDTLTANITTAQNLLNAQNLETATNTVNGLFTDAGKTTLSASTNQAAIDAAKAQVGVLPAGPEKTLLNADISNAQNLLSTQNLATITTSVNNLFTDAEKTTLKGDVTQATIDGLKAQVEALPDGADKTALNASITKAQDLLTAQNNTQSIAAATTAVNNLFTNAEKTALKGDVTQATIDAAKTQVMALADGADKTALNTDITKAQGFLDATTATLQTATTAVNNLFTDTGKTALKTGVTQATIDAAKAQVMALTDGAEKTALNAAITKAQGFLDATVINPGTENTAATTAVNNLFSDTTHKALKAGVTQTTINTAKATVNALPDGAQKTTLTTEITKAQGLLNTQIKNTTAATTAVNNLFSNTTHKALKAGVTQTTINAAKAKVNVLPNGAQKTALTAEIAKAQKLVVAPKPAAKPTSLVDYLKSKKMDSGLTNRKKLAVKYGVKNYTGTATQNTALLNKLFAVLK